MFVMTPQTSLLSIGGTPSGTGSSADTYTCRPSVCSCSVSICYIHLQGRRRLHTWQHAHVSHGLKAHACMHAPIRYVDIFRGALSAPPLGQHRAPNKCDCVDASLKTVVLEATCAVSIEPADIISGQVESSLPSQWIVSARPMLAT